MFELSRPIKIVNGVVKTIEKNEIERATWKKCFLSLIGKSYHIGLDKSVTARRPYIKTLPSIRCLGQNGGYDDDIIFLHSGQHILTEPITIRRRGTLIGCALGALSAIPVFGILTFFFVLELNQYKLAAEVFRRYLDSYNKF